MSGLRGFGLIFENGRARHWYVDRNGVKRWVDDASPVEPVLPKIAPPDPIAALETSEGLLGLQSDNCDIDVSESAFYPLTRDEETEQVNLRG